MSRERDAQRERLYRAERSVRGVIPGQSFDVGDFDTVARYVNNLLGQQWVRRNWPGAPRRLEVVWHRGGTRAVATWYGRSILMPLTLNGEPARWAWTEIVVLHELAHHLVGHSPAGGAHGWKFAAAFLRLIRNRMGRDAEATLRAAFRSHRVKYTKPRTLSPEQREAAAARLAVGRDDALVKARAAKAAKADAERREAAEAFSWDDDRFALIRQRQVLEQITEATGALFVDVIVVPGKVTRDRWGLTWNDHLTRCVTVGTTEAEHVARGGRPLRYYRPGEALFPFAADQV